MFIRVELCNHDFASELQEAVTHVFKEWGALISAEEFRKCVVELTYAYVVVRRKGIGNVRTYDYLDSKIKVTYTKNAVELPDHDGASVAVDTNLGYVWRF